MTSDTSPPEPLTADVRDAAQAILDGCKDCDNNRICPIELNVILNEHSETVARALIAALEASATDGWLPIKTAPTDEWVLLCTKGGWVGEAIYGEDDEEPRWRWRSGDWLHENHRPFGWQPLPKAIDRPRAEKDATHGK